MNFLRKRKNAAAKKKKAAEGREENETFMLKNGRFMLEELITSFNGKSNPIRSFSAPVILKATNNFDYTLVCTRDGQYRWYKGIIEDLPVLVKRSWGSTFGNNQMKMITMDIAVSSQMSSHKNVLKLLGCCLEFRYPVLVFEYVENGPLNKFHGGLDTGETLPWNIRLKIAKETANALSYLHTAFPKRIVHGDISPGIIFLDEKWTAKISDFTLSISIPDGEPHVKIGVIYGTIGFIPADYLDNHCINESTDVFGFGTTLLVLITGKTPSFPNGLEYGSPAHPKDTVAYAREITGKTHSFLNGLECRSSAHLKDLVASARENDQLIEILDPKLVEDAVAEEALELQQIQWKAYIELALKCTGDKREDRPQMIEVAKELISIEKLTKLSDMNLDKQSEHVAPPVESNGNIQRQRADNRVARFVQKWHSFPYFLREYQSLLGLMLIFYLLLQWNT